MNILSHNKQTINLSYSFQNNAINIECVYLKLIIRMQQFINAFMFNKTIKFKEQINEDKHPPPDTAQIV